MSERVIRLYLNSVIYNKADAQDILQRVALRAYRKFGDYDSAQPFQGWVFGIAKFEVLGYFRDHGRNMEVIDSEISERLADNMEDQSEIISREEAQEPVLFVGGAACPGRGGQQCRQKEYDELFHFVRISLCVSRMGLAVPTLSEKSNIAIAYHPS